jgi:hypothetical protein
MRNLDNIVDEKARRYAAKKNPELKKELDEIQSYYIAEQQYNLYIKNIRNVARKNYIEMV